ncbi:hypothetical protein J008_01476 [Cryptococcus neoformans]|uniref:Aminotransferase class I/classII large domain-containing protein n=1 Tax=Cryptococcus neoformans Tu259-1 TaxID=1230072 RepID=A0A854QHK7_CRYNE|nr:hypothetical protein C362_00001 [Cryptococcus neoformans var. grubii Bt1]OWZ59457.1 hypothetical protein C353_00002 [Cryptococcus neoformans var. grubii AD1-83a]OXG26088.1 hypothetical protein C361_01491 [Cryptococcus neoformans var. grubii Tu259-1]OXG41951.1 hypothetical protein C359_03367 [Cryptococcus neoformans var. grubii Bt120]OXG65467.1 hypothetical protein C354_01523 [Cryptococcus neoformans var. grubii MW-RSA1955]OXG69694.1 hypothetical protein C351_00002 [Cryptococcus neoformans v
MVRADERVSSTTALSHKLEELACNGNSLDIHPSKLLYASPWIDQVKEHAGIRLSDRALLCPTHAQAEKLDSMMCSLYDVHNNPEGVVNLGVAENGLMTDEYIKYFGEALRKGLNPVDMGYGDRLSGSARLKNAIADMFNENFDPIEPVVPEHIITGTGCTTVLDQLSWTILNPGDAILIAAPFYAGFDVNMVSRSGSHVVPVYVPDGEKAIAPESLAAFEDSLQACKDEGREVKAVLLCNPQNPLGRTYPRETILAYAMFAEKHNLHLISDEIYALSVYDNPNLPDFPEFISFLNIDVEKETGKKFDKSRLHIVYSFSKDFGANGLRVGCIISQNNPLLLRAMLHTCFLMKVSSPADVLLSTLLNDKPAFKAMISENRRRLTAASTFCREWFRKRGVHAFNTVAGHFMLVDFQKHLNITTFNQEKELWQRLLDAGVYTATGGGYHWKYPGFLRITFSVNQDSLKLGLERIEKELGLKIIA